MSKQRRVQTGDRGPPGETEILTTEQIGPKRHRTPNGNLLCEAVPIARVGWMIYADGEVPLKAGKETGYIRVLRTEESLFDPKTVGSFMGVAVVDDHPDDDVTPKNWRKLGMGFSTTNVHRGEGENADCLVADLIVTDEDLIKQILSGKVEVSCGYDADYEQTGDGTGLQTNIIGNHIALVEKGRCGPRCAIGDREPTLKETKMATKRTQIKERIRARIADMESLLEDSQDTPGSEGDSEGEGGGTHIHIHGGSAGGEAPAGKPAVPAPGQDDLGGEGGDDPIEARFTAIESSISELTAAVKQLVGGGQAPAGDAEGDPDEEDDGEGDPTKDEDLDPETDLKTGKTGDSAALGNAYSQLLADAEVLVPGFRAATFDAKAKRKATVDRMCNVRRKVLDAFAATTMGHQMLATISGKKTYDSAAGTCVETATLFRAAAGAQKTINNRAATGDSNRLPNSDKPASTMNSIAAANAAAAKFWQGKGA